MNVRVAQLGEDWALNHGVGGSSPGCAKFTKSLAQAFNSSGLFESRCKTGRLSRCTSVFRTFHTLFKFEAAQCDQFSCVAQCILLEVVDNQVFSRVYIYIFLYIYIFCELWLFNRYLDQAGLFPILAVKSLYIETKFSYLPVNS